MMRLRKHTEKERCCITLTDIQVPESEKKDHEQSFKEVGEAYAVLGDSKKKREYDSGQDIANTCMNEGFHDFDPFEMFRSFEGCHGSSNFGAGSDGFRSSGFGGHSFHFTF